MIRFIVILKPVSTALLWLSKRTYKFTIHTHTLGHLQQKIIRINHEIQK